MPDFKTKFLPHFSSQILLTKLPESKSTTVFFFFFPVPVSPWVRETSWWGIRQTYRESGLVYNKHTRTVQPNKSATFQEFMLGHATLILAMPELSSKYLGTSLWRMPSELVLNQSFEKPWQCLTFKHSFRAKNSTVPLVVHCTHPTGGSQPGVIFSPQGTLVNVWRHIWLSHWGVGGYWHLVGRGQGRRETARSAQDSSPQQRIIQPKMSIVPRLRNPDDAPQQTSDGKASLGRFRC